MIRCCCNGLVGKLYPGATPGTGAMGEKQPAGIAGKTPQFRFIQGFTTMDAEAIKALQPIVGSVVIAVLGGFWMYGLHRLLKD